VWTDEERAQKLAKLEAKLKPERIRSTLAFAGLYQLTHELIKQAVVPQVRGFYLTGFDEKGMHYDEEAYKKNVLSKDRRVFRASLLWLVEAEAIMLEQADRLDEIYNHRHELTHELANYIVHPDLEPNGELFLDAVKILRDISAFWTQYEIDIGTLRGVRDVSVEDAPPMSLVVLQMCIDAYVEGLPGAPAEAATSEDGT